MRVRGGTRRKKIGGRWRESAQGRAGEKARGRLRRGAQEAGRRTQYGRGKTAAAAAAGMAADHPVARNRPLAGKGMAQPAARRGLPAARERFQACQKTEYEREDKRMGPIRLREALSQGGETFGQEGRVLCHGWVYI